MLSNSPRIYIANSETRQIQTTQKYLHALTEADQRNIGALDKMTRGRE